MNGMSCSCIIKEYMWVFTVVTGLEAGAQEGWAEVRCVSWHSCWQATSKAAGDGVLMHSSPAEVRLHARLRCTW